MIALAALALFESTNMYIAPCPLPERAAFFTTLAIVPPAIRTDLLAYAGPLADPGGPANFADVGDPRRRNAGWRYVMQLGDKWFITYTHDAGVAVRTITVAYELDEQRQPDKPLFLGAVVGEVCTAIEYLRGTMGIEVLETRQSRQPAP